MAGPGRTRRLSTRPLPSYRLCTRGVRPVHGCHSENPSKRRAFRSPPSRPASAQRTPPLRGPSLMPSLGPEARAREGTAPRRPHRPSRPHPKGRHARWRRTLSSARPTRARGHVADDGKAVDRHAQARARVGAWRDGRRRPGRHAPPFRMLSLPVAVTRPDESKRRFSAPRHAEKFQPRSTFPHRNRLIFKEEVNWLGR